jgi:NAD(P)-dependent dehydrogenase (short-subunit alcohol dehydrogenase family)
VVAGLRERLEGKTAIVTGAAAGIGSATAVRLAEEGAGVVVADIDAVGARQVADEIEHAGGHAVAVEVDVRLEADIVRMVEVATSTFGRLDVLHNNAAEQLAADGIVTELDVDVWDRTFATDLRSVMLGCKHGIPAMLAGDGGSIVNTSSIGALSASQGHTAYGAAKAGMIALTRYVATQYSPQGIRCNVVVPGLVLDDGALERFTPDQLLEYECERLIERVGRPSDIAALVAFLASDESGYITGQTIVADGGYLVHRPSYTLDTWRQKTGID